MPVEYVSTFPGWYAVINEYSHSDAFHFQVRQIFIYWQIIDVDGTDFYAVLFSSFFV